MSRPARWLLSRAHVAHRRPDRVTQRGQAAGPGAVGKTPWTVRSGETLAGSPPPLQRDRTRTYTTHTDRIQADARHHSRCRAALPGPNRPPYTAPAAWHADRMATRAGVPAAGGPPLDAAESTWRARRCEPTRPGRHAAAHACRHHGDAGAWPPLPRIRRTGSGPAGPGICRSRGRRSTVR